VTIFYYSYILSQFTGKINGVLTPFYSSTQDSYPNII